MGKLVNCLKMIKLLESHQYQIHELAKFLGVSERMIREYKKEIKEAGIDIRSRCGKNGGYYIPKEERCEDMQSKNILEEVLTLAEAAQIWKKDTSTLRNAIRFGKFRSDEIRKSGNVWLIKKTAMIRQYGKVDCDRFYDTHKECEYCKNRNECRELAYICRPNPKDHEDDGIVL